MGWDEVEDHKSVKREQGQYPAILTELVWSIKDLFYLINRNLWTAMKNELSLSGVTSQVIEPRLSMGVNVLCFELAVILEFSAF